MSSLRTAAVVAILISGFCAVTQVSSQTVATKPGEGGGGQCSLPENDIEQITCHLNKPKSGTLFQSSSILGPTLFYIRAYPVL